MKKILTAGYASIDRIFKVTESPSVGKTSLVLNKNNCDKLYGGCSPNIAYNLSKLGVNALPVMRVGRDFEELGYKQYLVNGGVKLDHVKVIEEDVCPFTFLLEDPNLEHTTIFYAGAQNQDYFETLDDEIFKDVTYGVITVGDFKDNREFLDKCMQHNIKVIFGMRGDENAFPKSFLKDVLTYSSIIFMNEIESEFIKTYLNLKDICDLFKIGRCETVVVTLGANGSKCYSKNCSEIIHTPICKCNVVDTTGSGDAFISGFIYGLINDKDTKTCMQYGALESSFIIEGFGCTTNAPNKEEFENTYLKNF